MKFTTFKVQNFEFIAPYPLEECVPRIQGLQTPWTWADHHRSFHNLTVELAHPDPDVCRYELRRAFGKNLGVKLTGELRRIADQATLVSGQADQINAGFIFSIYFYGFLMVACLAFGAWQFIIVWGIFLAVFLLVAGISWRISLPNCRQLVQEFRVALEPETATLS